MWRKQRQRYCANFGRQRTSGICASTASIKQIAPRAPASRNAPTMKLASKTMFAVTPCELHLVIGQPAVRSALLDPADNIAMRNTFSLSRPQQVTY